jgi:hypothetical protein
MSKRSSFTLPILCQDEFYFRLEKHFRGVRVDRNLQSTGFLIAYKAQRQSREQHLISAPA